MKGKYKIIIRNNRLHYEFLIKRNITIIRGDSATGKTTLINMLRQADNLGISSGINVISSVPCKILEGRNWKLILENSVRTIFFIDEENAFINTEEFALAIRNSDNYFVLVTRENLYNLPYSVEEIYGLHCSGKYHDTRRIYQQMYQIYSDYKNIPIIPEKIVTEDSNAGFEFFKAIAAEKEICCESAGGKSNIFAKLNQVGNETVCLIADGAAIGPEMNRLYKLSIEKKNIHLYFPESFEWLILNSGIFSGKELLAILKEPENYIESKDYFSWERFFTKLLIERSKDSYLKYSKSKLNKAYLDEKNRKLILESIKGVKF